MIFKYYFVTAFLRVQQYYFKLAKICTIHSSSTVYPAFSRPNCLTYYDCHNYYSITDNVDPLSNMFDYLLLDVVRLY